MASLKDIEILTHCDVNRLNRAYLMAKTMPKELTISLIIGYKDEADKSYSLANKPENIKVYFEYYDPETIYPTNRFRNIAFEKSTRAYVFYLDVDFIFQHDFWSNFSKQYLPKLNEDVVLCPMPLFEENQPAYLSKYNPEELVKTETEATHEGILGDDFTKKADLFKFHDRWVDYPQKEALADLTPVMRSIRNSTILPEPWGVLHRSRYLFADESFLGRVKDKQQFVCRLLDSGLKFYSMRDCVMYHLWHPDSRHDINREKENCVNTLLFNKKYLHQYQNFFFQLANSSLFNSINGLLEKFQFSTPIQNINESDTPDTVIPMMKKRPMLISNAAFHPEYSVYGYKLIYVYNSKNKNEISERLSTNENTASKIYNLNYFAIELDLADRDLALKKLQDLMGYSLKENGVNRVATQSPGPEVSFTNK